MKLTAKDARHIGSFKEGAFKTWAEIMDEVKARRNEHNKDAIKQAASSLALTFD